MPVKSAKEEVRMRRSRYGPPRWSFVPPAPGTDAKFRRWNIILIVILAFFVLGVFVVARAPEPGSNASEGTQVSLKTGRAAASTSPHQVKSNRAQPARGDRELLPVG
jgi:hypothetical protein